MNISRKELETAFMEWQEECKTNPQDFDINDICGDNYPRDCADYLWDKLENNKQTER